MTRDSDGTLCAFAVLSDFNISHYLQIHKRIRIIDYYGIESFSSFFIILSVNTLISITLEILYVIFLGLLK